MALALATAWAELDTARYKAEFYRMWYAGHHAGLAHPRALEILDDFRRSPTTRDIRNLLLAGTKRGVALATLTKAKPQLFVPFEAALLRLGEESGHLEECLRLLADYFSAEHRMMVWLKGKLTYPMFQALAACFIAPFPLLFFGHTAQYIALAGGGLLMLAATGGTILKSAAAFYSRRPKFVLARLMRALTTAVEAGLPLDRSVALAVDAAGSERLRAHVAAQGKAVGHQPLARTFEGSGILPREAVAAMEVAEATGDYSGTLKRLAELYDEGFAGGPTSRATAIP